MDLRGVARCLDNRNVSQSVSNGGRVHPWTVADFAQSLDGGDNILDNSDSGEYLDISDSLDNADIIEGMDIADIADSIDNVDIMELDIADIAQSLDSGNVAQYLNEDPFVKSKFMIDDQNPDVFLIDPNDPDITSITPLKHYHQTKSLSEPLEIISHSEQNPMVPTDKSHTHEDKETQRTNKRISTPKLNDIMDRENTANKQPQHVSPSQGQRGRMYPSDVNPIVIVKDIRHHHKDAKIEIISDEEPHNFIPQKRGRGRPRKNEEPHDVINKKRGRGRPKKSQSHGINEEITPVGKPEKGTPKTRVRIERKDSPRKGRFTCQYCTQRFHFEVQRDHHVIKVHPHLEPEMVHAKLPCFDEACTKTFQSEAMRKQHWARWHKGKNCSPQKRNTEDSE